MRLLPLGQLAAGAAAWLCGTWFVYLLDGICDQTEDRWQRIGAADRRRSAAGPPGTDDPRPAQVMADLAVSVGMISLGLADSLATSLLLACAVLLCGGGRSPSPCCDRTGRWRLKVSDEPGCAGL
jgi:hypothetical protein